jgi:peptidoglycan/LPS O-acetylase OafA/YrhL
LGDDARTRADRTSYRPDIDGLRAIAIALVVLYHAGLGFPGGFIGVDVFFVISGYLITGILFDASGSKRTSIADFYRRRIKRILPALVVVYLFCVVVGAAILLPIDFNELLTSLAASAAFASNIFFYTTSGYFDGPAFEKPLLHTWSLSVEEQFYLVWPLLCLILLFRLGAKGRAMVTALLLAAPWRQRSGWCMRTGTPRSIFL